MSRVRSEKAQATLPAHIFNNTTGVDRKLTIKPVQQLAYNYDGDRFGIICHKAGLSKKEYIIAKELVFLNSGYLTPALVLAHLGRGYDMCIGLVYELVAEKQAAHPKADRQLYLLPPTRRPQTI